MGVGDGPTRHEGTPPMVGWQEVLIIVLAAGVLTSPAVCRAAYRWLFGRGKR